MKYELLTEEQQERLRQERLFALEADHFRHALLAEEDPMNQELSRQVRELRDRITHHRRVFKNLSAEKETPMDSTEG